VCHDLTVSEEAEVGTVGDGRCDGAPPGQPSRIPGSKPGGRPAGSGGSRRNGPLVPSLPRCGTIPPTLPPGRADGDDGDDGARTAARGDAGNCDPLGKDNAAAAAASGEADDMGQENNDRGSEGGDDYKDNDKWGRGA
jgi:hypothetical protein